LTIFFMSDKKERLHAVVSGAVQGVYFRATTQTRAQQLGLAGWVKNLSDGSVEVAAEGPHGALLQLLDFLRTGPPEAMVAEVREEWSTASGEFGYFEVRW
jgi:acylphosphatase